MNSLFLSTTPFQIMASIQLNIAFGQPAKLVIIDKFADSQRLCKEIKRCGIFSDVEVLDDSKIWKSKSKSWLEQRLSTVQTYVFCRKIVEKYFPNISSYTDIFVSSRAQVNRLVCMYVAEWLPTINIHFYDDGLGSYTGSVIKVKFLDKVLRAMFVGKRASRFGYDMYLYNPKMFYTCHRRTNLDIKRITVSQKGIAIINSLYPFNMEMDDTMILFDTIHHSEFSQVGVEKYEELVRQLIDTFNISIKKHPRDHKNTFKAKYIMTGDIPFEVICSNVDFTNRVLITTFSTAVFSPKLLFDQEPTVVFLYKIMGAFRNNNSLLDDEIVDMLKKSYDDSSKIIVPNTKEELLLALLNITNAK